MSLHRAFPLFLLVLVGCSSAATEESGESASNLSCKDGWCEWPGVGLRPDPDYIHCKRPSNADLVGHRTFTQGAERYDVDVSKYTFRDKYDLSLKATGADGAVRFEHTWTAVVPQTRGGDCDNDFAVSAERCRLSFGARFEDTKTKFFLRGAGADCNVSASRDDGS